MSLLCEGMPPVKESCHESLARSHSCSSDTHTVLRGQRSTAKTENKIVCFQERQALHRLSSESQPHTCYFELAEAQLKDSCISGCLSLASCLELKQESFTLPLGSPFPPRRLCEYTKQAAG